jgi:hypothetical protein
MMLLRVVQRSRDMTDNFGTSNLDQAGLPDGAAKPVPDSPDLDDADEAQLHPMIRGLRSCPSEASKR